MGKLEAVFRIHLAYPVITLMGNQPPITVSFPKTGDAVRIYMPEDDATATGPPFGGTKLTLIVECHCNEQPLEPLAGSPWRSRVEREAAHSLHQFFEATRDSIFRRKNVVSTYPVARSEDIGSNLLVWGYEIEWIYEGNSFLQQKYPRGMPAIEITGDAWRDATEQLAAGKTVPAYRSFALDAFYFSDQDSFRGIVMACAAWETALRFYLANVASKRDAAYDIASRMRGIPTLYRFAKQARGRSLFEDWITELSAGGSDIEYRNLRITVLRGYKALVEALPEARNRFLHEGTPSADKPAADYALAVADAIDWLFDTSGEG